jgi:hypothetical protein
MRGDRRIVTHRSRLGDLSWSAARWLTNAITLCDGHRPNFMNVAWAGPDGRPRIREAREISGRRGVKEGTGNPI